MTSIYCQDVPNGGIIETKTDAFFVSAPKGWVFSFEEGQRSGLEAVMYPLGSNWADAPTVFYVNTAHLNNTSQKNVNDVIEHDIERIKAANASVNIEYGTTLNTGKRKNAAITLYVLGNQYDNYEAVAYIQEDNMVAILVMSTRDHELFQRHFPDFVYLVESYYYIEKAEK